jgi:hypothetical protein
VLITVSNTEPNKNLMNCAEAERHQEGFFILCFVNTIGVNPSFQYAIKFKLSFIPALIILL